VGTSRRTALKVLAGAAAVAAAGAGDARAARPRRAPEDPVGMLYDTTLCIGCKACVVACREANGMPTEAGPWPEGIYDAPLDLSASTRNIIKLHQDREGRSYMKSQCMHCLDPACVGACMLGALKKDPKTGVVAWNGGLCVGCRYCQMACPFNVPKFEWASLNPRIVKCELCSHRLADGKIPACCEVCPSRAVIYGRRSDLLAEARRRLAEHPERYVPKIYGEHDGGGTQVLYLSHVPFEKLGLPPLGERSQADVARGVQHTVYKGFVAPVGLYAVLAAVILYNRRRQAAEGAPETDHEPSR
jgi:Fe-S-cluster-containing dehydrogenase component